MEKTLVMAFRDEKGKKVSMSLTDVKDDIEKEEIKTFMQTILDKQESFDVKNPLSKIASANIVEKTVNTLFDNENNKKEEVEA